MSEERSSTQIKNWLEIQQKKLPETDLSIIIPAYNEQWRLPTTLVSTIDYLDSTKRNYEIIVVDDGSKDETSLIVKKFERIRSQVRLITLARNRGKGEAVKTGGLNAKGRKILFCDADGATPISEIVRLEEAINNGNGLAFGSRALESDETKVRALWYRKLIGRFFNFIVSALLLPGVKDTQCGFKMFSDEAAKFLFSRQELAGFAFDVELLFMAARSGMKSEEVAVNWRNMPGSKVNLVTDSTKMFLEVLSVYFKHRKIDRFG